MLQTFKLKDLGNLKYFLSKKFAQPNKGFLLSQCNYSLEILKDTRFLVANSSKSPTLSSHFILNRMIWLRLVKGEGLHFFIK